MGASATQRQQLMQYRIEHRRSFLEYLIVPESHNAISLDIDARIAAGIARGLLLMLTTIKLNHQLCVQACEIRHISTDWNLAAKAESAQLSAPQMSPQQPLSVSGLIAQPAGTNLYQFIAQSPPSAPLPVFPGPPLPMDSYTTLFPPLPPSRPSPASGGRGAN